MTMLTAAIGRAFGRGTTTTTGGGEGDRVEESSSRNRRNKVLAKRPGRLALPEVVVVSYGEVSEEWRSKVEGKTIRMLVERWGGRVVECDESKLAETLAVECGARKRRVAVHLVGHHCSTEDFGRKSKKVCEALSIWHASPTTTSLRKIKLIPGSSRAELVQVLRAQKLEVVFCNASQTQALADDLKCPSFGWKTACVEEGAVRLAAYFYAALEDAATYDEAFAVAAWRMTKAGRRQPSFALVDPSDPDAIHRAMPGKLIAHLSSSVLVMRPSDDHPDGGGRRPLSDGSMADGLTADESTKRVRISSLDSSSSGDVTLSTSTLSLANNGSTSMGSDIATTGSDLATNSMITVCNNVLASFHVDLRPSCPSSIDDDDLYDDLDVVQHTMEIIFDDKSYDWGPDAKLPVGQPYANDPHTQARLAQTVSPSPPPVVQPPPRPNPQRGRPTTAASELTQIASIGKAKAKKLKSQGIHTVEALAKVDVSNIPLAKAATGNKRWDEAVDTLTRWRNAARQHLASRSRHFTYDGLSPAVTPP